MPLEFSWPLVGLATALGLVAGSFLNVLIYRLPRMLEREWAHESALHLCTEVPQHPPLNLFFLARTARTVRRVFAGMTIFRC